MRDGYTWVDLRDLRGDVFKIEDYTDGELLLRSLTGGTLLIVVHDGIGFVAYTPDKEDS